MKPLSFLIFLGSFVSFALEPMIGRTLLPAFGGTPSVWVTCLAAFQLLMVGGYFYAQCVSGEGKRVWRVHFLLLVLAAAWCVAVAYAKGPLIGALESLTGVPALNVLVCVVVLAGVTFVLLSANATVVQVLSGGDYRLYAWSNAGSLIGLLAYPLVIEPFVGVRTQWVLAGAATAVYAVLLWRAARGNEKSEECVRETEDGGGAPSAAQLLTLNSKLSTLLYFLIPAVTCALLNAITSHLTLDVMPLPLLWALLLGVFLVSYIIGFSGWGQRFIPVWAVLGVVSTAALGLADMCPGLDARLQCQFAAGLATILFVCTCLHSILYSIRPSGGRLAGFYLSNVVGGAVGGLATGIVAPLVFNRVYEHPIMLGTAALLIAVLAKGLKLRVVTAVLALTTVGLTTYDTFWKSSSFRPMIHYSRGFFGTISVQETPAQGMDGKGAGVLHEFFHGSTSHGMQARMPGRERMPTCYYAKGAVGYGIAGHPKYRRGEPMRVCLVGMGVGVLFSYGRTNDYYRAYEISRDVVDIATNAALFSFVADCPARTDIAVNDARKGLEAELKAGVEPYDVIVVDAFTGDNVPYHLSSREAFELYFRMLKPDGMLAVNISNRYFDMIPYAKRIGEEFNVPMTVIDTAQDMVHLSFATTSAFFMRNAKGYGKPQIGNGPGLGTYIDLRRVPSMGAMPTDDKGSFISLLEW